MNVNGLRSPVVGSRLPRTSTAEGLSTFPKVAVTIEATGGGYRITKFAVIDNSTLCTWLMLSDQSMVGTGKLTRAESVQ